MSRASPASSGQPRWKVFLKVAFDEMDRPGWRKFLLAMLALVIAFLLAVYSSIFAQEGKVVATGICATLALALAGYVALTAVPYLARRTRLEWLRLRMDYQLTREGYFFIALIFLISIAGLNTGNNLLYLILSSMLAAILMSGILSLAVLTGLDLEVLLPDHVFARRPVPARIRLRNEKKRMPSFSITISGSGNTLGTNSGARQEKAGRKAAARQSQKSQGGETRDRRILRAPLYFPFLPGGGTVSRSVELEFPRRGLYREDGFALSTRFPFGFLEKRLRLVVRRDLWVYPAVAPTEEFYEILPMLSGEIEAWQKGRGHDLYSIREMQPTDSARHVDWKASARTGSPKVREFAREDERRLQLILDHRIGKPEARCQELFEAAVEFCACLAWHFHEVDAQLQFRCGDFQTAARPAGEIIYDILRYLAKVEPSFEEPMAPLPAAAEEDLFRIVCTALPRGSVPTMLWSRSYYVFFDTLRPINEARPSVIATSEVAPPSEWLAQTDGS